MGMTGIEPAHLAVLDPKSSDRLYGLDFSPPRRIVIVPRQHRGVRVGAMEVELPVNFLLVECAGRSQ